MQIDERFHIVSFKTNKASIVGGELLLDGKPMKGVRAIKIEASIEGAASVTIEMIANVDCGGTVIDMTDMNDKYRKYDRI